MKRKKLTKLLSCVLISALSITLFILPDKAFATTNNKEDLNRKIVGYFPEWAYKSKSQAFFDVADLQWDDLTHIQYSFCMVNPKTNKIEFGDKHAAIEETFKNHPLYHNGKEIKLDPNLPYKGHFNVLQVMKKKYPNVKLLMSVGGWAGTRGFYTMIDTDEGINTFADSCVDFIRKYGFDGIDIDFEYPSSTPTCGNPKDSDLSEPRRATLNKRYNVLMKTLRERLDKASKEDGKDYLETAAVTASSWVLGGMSDNSYAKDLDFLSVMSYDFHGGWNEYVENLANIYPNPNDNETKNMLMPTLNMDWAYRYYRGVLPPEKILMGIPYYTRGWENVTGGSNGLHGKSKTPASGKYNVWGDDLNGDGKLEPAGANPLWHVLNLADKDPNLKKYFDNVGKVPHYFEDKENVFLSFEDEQSIDERVKYIKDNNLGGALIWVMNGDYGKNPNYVPGSNDINEGKYTFGDTLTERLKGGLDKLGPCTVTNDDKTASLSPINVNVKLNGKYDHPNYSYAFNITNNTTEKIPGGWTLSFDLPKSCEYKSSWGGQATVKEGKDFNTITITGGAWQSIDPNASIDIQGTIGLCFSGIRNVTFNNKRPTIGNEKFTGDSNTNTSPSKKPVTPDKATDPVKPSVDNTKDTYIKGKAYSGGQSAIYNGKTYNAKWWTNTIPGSDDSWQLIK